MEKILKIPEIIAPAGSLESAIYAFKAGADAVYFGLTDFSARKYAVNFTNEQYRKLLYFAKNNNKKIYLTLNTIIKEDEIQKLINLLKFLSLFPPDAIIIQDFGIISIIRYFLKGINIHASTQSGTHSIYSYDYLNSLDIKRVILSRECTFDDIKNIKDIYKNLELEVFIHGALCYSFSGFCLASGLLLGRSGNKGECAQICRNYFKIVSDEQFNNMSLTLFSCNDLFLKDNIIKLAEIGVNSFKIEGRMKSPEYTYYTVRLYRKILDKYLENSDKYKEENLEKKDFDNIKLSFARIETDGYFSYKSGDKLVNPLYPSHLGLFLGKLIDININQNYILVKLDEDITKKDGILILLKLKNQIISYPFSVDEIFVKGKKVLFAKKGDIVEIYSDNIPEFTKKFLEFFNNYKIKDIKSISTNILEKLNISQIIFNDFVELRKISDRNLDLKKLNENTFQEIKIIINLCIELKLLEKSEDESNFTLILEYSYNFYHQKYKHFYQFNAFKRTGNLSFLKVFTDKIEKETKDDLFVINTQISQQSIDIFNIIFMPPSQTNKMIENIKQDIRNKINSYLDESTSIIPDKLNIKDYQIEKKFYSFSKKENLIDLIKSKLTNDDFFDRKQINPINNINNFNDNKILPFVTFENLTEINILKNDSFYRLDNIVFLPLNPIISDESNYIDRLEKLINNNKDFVYIFGINSSWHFHIYQKYLNNENVFFFLDFYIYLANSFSYKFYCNFEKILFGFYWVEFAKEIKEKIYGKILSSEMPLFNILSNFNLPLFISRGCLKRNLFNNGICPKNCDKKFIQILKNQKNKFLYANFECISYLFKIEK